ncbi:hypothetical protein WJX82_008061 [Trebouxia sp. C0006]
MGGSRSVVSQVQPPGCAGSLQPSQWYSQPVPGEQAEQAVKCHTLLYCRDPSCVVLCNTVSILAVTGLMTLFSSQLELKQYLVEINPRYSNYAEALWANGVNSSSQLGNAPAPILADFGVQNALHAADIIAASKPTVAIVEDVSDMQCEDLRAKTAQWSTLYYGQLPYLITFAAAKTNIHCEPSQDIASSAELPSPGNFASGSVVFRSDLCPMGLRGADAMPKDEAQLARAAHGCLHGLEALHKADFVHRDLRWANVACTLDRAYFLLDLETCHWADKIPKFHMRIWEGLDCRVAGAQPNERYIA